MILLAVILVIAGAILYGKISPSPKITVSPTITQTSSPTLTPSLTIREESQIIVTNPLPNQVVSNPMQISGKAPGNWFFEGVAPAKLADSNGTTIATGQIKAQGDWQTTNQVPFTGELSFDKPKTSTGILILQNDNPSGNLETSQKVEILIRFR